MTGAAGDVPGRSRPTGLDVAMLALAVASIALLCWESFGSVDDDTRRWIVRADLSICALFAAEFLLRWHRAGWSGRHLLRNWTDLLGMVPVASPALRSLRLVRVVILLGRFARVADRVLGAGTTTRLLDRASRPLVNAISGSVTLAVLDEVAEVLSAGTYTRNLVRALDENERELRLLIAEKLRQDPRIGRLAGLPFYGDVVEAIVEAMLTLSREVLDDPRTEELVADVLRENVAQLRRAVRARRDGQPPDYATAASATG